MALKRTRSIPLLLALRLEESIVALLRCGYRFGCRLECSAAVRGQACARLTCVVDIQRSRQKLRRFGTDRLILSLITRYFGCGLEILREVYCQCVDPTIAPVSIIEAKGIKVCVGPLRFEAFGHRLFERLTRSVLNVGTGTRASKLALPLFLHAE